MSREWIESLASGLKEKGREPAEAYARKQHQDGIIGAEGKVFFTALVMNLEQDVAEVRSQLQGSAISCETSLTRESPTQVRLNRGRFPWFDATLRHDEASVILEYVQGRGLPGGQSLVNGADRQVISFSFLVDAQDRLSVSEAFGKAPCEFKEPQDLARSIVERLFKV